IASASKSRSRAGRPTSVPTRRSWRPEHSANNEHERAQLALGLSEARGELRDNATELVDDHASDDLTAFHVQVRPIDLALLVPRAQVRPDIVADILGVGEADRVKVDERDALFLRQRPDCLDVRGL